MFWMAYRQNNLGAGNWTSFQVAPNTTKTIDIRPRTPNQRIVCAGNLVTKQGSKRADLIFGTAGRDVINARGGDDVIWGMGGPDVICGDLGDDVILGGDGNDYLIGDAGDDLLLGEDGDDFLIGGAGNDRMIGSYGDDRFWGLDGVDDWAMRLPGRDRVNDAERLTAMRVIVL